MIGPGRIPLAGPPAGRRDAVRVGRADLAQETPAGPRAAAIEYDFQSTCMPYRATRWPRAQRPFQSLRSAIEAVRQSTCMPQFSWSVARLERRLAPVRRSARDASRQSTSTPSRLRSARHLPPPRQILGGRHLDLRRRHLRLREGARRRQRERKRRARRILAGGATSTDRTSDRARDQGARHPAQSNRRVDAPPPVSSGNPRFSAADRGFPPGFHSSSSASGGSSPPRSRPDTASGGRFPASRRPSSCCRRPPPGPAGCSGARAPRGWPVADLAQQAAAVAGRARLGPAANLGGRSDGRMDVALRDGHGALDGVLELAHVAGPRRSPSAA